MTEREKDQDTYATLVVLGIVALMWMAGNAMYYSGHRNSWVPMAVAAVLAVVMLAYVRVRGTFR